MTVTVMTRARRVRVRGIVQGVGFRPFVFRLARSLNLTGWVLNAGDGVEIHAEGSEAALEEFLRELRQHPPIAARVVAMDVHQADCAWRDTFSIETSAAATLPTAHVSPDLPVCAECLCELESADERRRGYPYINCTSCGPRHSIVVDLPYDRAQTTMAPWRMCGACEEEYHDPGNRRFHAQPTACWDCGPSFTLEHPGSPPRRGAQAITEAARLLAEGSIVAVKGLGGYHLACDATAGDVVWRLRARKFRKEKPFAIMVRDVQTAARLVALCAEAEAMLTSDARPIVLAPGRIPLDGVAPDTGELGVMLPYTPLHYLLFAAGAPEALVMTSGNRSSEPIAYDDEDARERLAGIADAWLVGERAVARRVEDSVVRAGVSGPAILRRSRGYAPAAVARLPAVEPVLAVGADLKNTITLVVDGYALVSQHVGDLEHYAATRAFEETVRDLLRLYDLSCEDVVLVHDQHPEYISTRWARERPSKRRVAVQHHRAHVASVLAERNALEAPVVGLSLDGTGYGDDGTIWGGELFAGTGGNGLVRVGHLRPAQLAGGDAAARDPVQAAAGFLAQLDGVPDLTSPPFEFPARYRRARDLIDKQVRVFRTTSAGRLFDTVAALAGFTRPITFEGQAAMWLEHLARRGGGPQPIAMPFDGREIDFRPALAELLERRQRGEDPARLARGFHAGFARALAQAAGAFCAAHGTDIVVLSGGVFQNELLLADLRLLLEDEALRVWTNGEVPANDGGISLGQAALAVSSSSP